MRLQVKLPRARIEDVVPEPSIMGGAAGYVPRPLPTVDAAIADRSLVLLVDDHPTNRMVIARQLGLAGYASEAAEDGQAGLERWRSGRYALVLTDVHMPRLDGYQFAHAIREAEAEATAGMPGMPRTPVVALTAAALKGEAERCLAAGMDDYLAKPVSIAVLAGCLQRWLPHTVPPADVVATQPQPLPQIQHPHELDSAVLDDLTGGVASQAQALMDDYLAATDEDLAALQAAIAGADAVEAGRQAHKIKGAARIVGAIELAEIASVLESAAEREGGDRATGRRPGPCRMPSAPAVAKRLRVPTAAASSVVGSVRVHSVVGDEEVWWPVPRAAWARPRSPPILPRARPWPGSARCWSMPIRRGPRRVGRSAAPGWTARCCRSTAAGTTRPGAPHCPKTPRSWWSMPRPGPWPATWVDSWSAPTWSWCGRHRLWTRCFRRPGLLRNSASAPRPAARGPCRQQAHPGPMPRHGRPIVQQCRPRCALPTAGLLLLTAGQPFDYLRRCATTRPIGSPC